MSNNAVSFNLLKFVEHRPLLSAGKIFSIIFLCALFLVGYFLYQINQIHQATKEASRLTAQINQLTQTLQPMLQRGVGNPVVGVLASEAPKIGQGFYPEFEALSHLYVKGLWLERVMIQRNPAFIKITGAMDAPEKVDQLLKQLAMQPVFKNVQFVGIDVSKGLMTNIPEKYQSELKQLKLPVFYHFVIQTTPIKSSVLKKVEGAL